MSQVLGAVPKPCYAITCRPVGWFDDLGRCTSLDLSENYLEHGPLLPMGNCRSLQRWDMPQHGVYSTVTTARCTAGCQSWVRDMVPQESMNQESSSMQHI